MTTVYAEMGKVFRLQRKGDETLVDFARRSVKKINAACDDDPDKWSSLSEDLQVWNNTSMQAIEIAGKDGTPDIPELVGWPADEEDSAEEETGEEEEASEEEASDDVETDAGEAASDTEVEPEEPVKPTNKGKSKPKKAAAKAVVAKPKQAKPKKTASKEEPKSVKAPVASKKKVKAAAKRGRQSQFALDARIKMLVKDNPHRPGTGRFKRWAKYKNNMTVAEALKAGFNADNLRYSVADGHIKIGA